MEPKSFIKLFWCVPLKDGELRTYDTKPAAMSAARSLGDLAYGEVYPANVHVYRKRSAIRG